MKKIIVEHNDFDCLKSFDWSLFAIDTETTSLRQDELEITGVSLCDGELNIYIPIGITEGNSLSDTVAEIVQNVTKDSKVIMHNSSFDLRVLKKFGVDLFNTKLFDTMIAAHLVDENGSKSLKELTRSILCREVADYDETISHYSEQFYEYALADSRNTFDLYNHYLPIIQSDRKLERLFFQIEMPFQKILAEMNINGVDIHLGRYVTMKEELNQEVLKLEKDLYDVIGEPYDIQMDVFGKPIGVVSNLNLNSAQQLIAVFEKLGLPITETTPSGAPSVGKLTLHQHKTHPFVKALAKYKAASKLLTAFFEPLPSHLQRDGKVRPSFNDTGARTGRLSCSNPNLQQLPNNRDDYNPADYRSLFIAPKGYKMITVDYSGQEVAVAAQVSKDPTLVESLNKGYDMHLAIANQFFGLGIPKESLNEEHKDHDKYKREFGEERKKAKAITFGLLFGKSAFGFSKDFGISEDEAQKIVDKYFEGMPVLKRTIDDTHRELKRDGFIVNLAGRRRHFVSNEQGFYPKKAFRQAFNFKIQGFAADMLRAAMVNTSYRASKHLDWDLKPIMTVHDEAVYVVKEDFVEPSIKLIKDAWQDVCRKFVVPVSADVSVGDNYAEAK